ncbi:MAG: hypothetical protein ACOVQ6_20320 [Brevundimonas sp.]
MRLSLHHPNPSARHRARNARPAIAAASCLARVAGASAVAAAGEGAR